MKRKLFSVLLCGFALILLTGAGVAESDVQAVMIGEEEPTAAYAEARLPAAAVPAAQGVSPQELAEQIDTALCVDGEYVSTETCRVQKDGVTYVALAPMAKVLDPAVQVTWDGATATAGLKTEKLTLTARVGQLYVQANGRYLYVPEGVQMVDGKVTVPLSVLTKAFDARLSWDGASGTVMVNRGSGAIQSGDSFYSGDDLFWLSRIIQAESGNQPLEGRVAVGNVVMNRVASPAFPNTVKEVLAQKNQFTTWKNGRLADRSPNEGSVIAAKLVLDGAVVEECEGATFFDSNTTSWAARNKTCIAVIGNHKFYK